MYGIYPRMLLRTRVNKSTINVGHDLTGQGNYDRHQVLEISTHINLTFFVVMIITITVILIIVTKLYIISLILH